MPKKLFVFALVNAEADELPGLIIDIHDTIAVMQINTWGMQRLKEKILSLLLKKLPPIIRGLREIRFFSTFARSFRREESDFIWESSSRAACKRKWLIYVCYP
ncbi:MULTISPECIES: hypothetical protein [Candidatus Rhabdochlamydia]|uniref:hypothetical protein n=1 Tax=Candidatus Rhabdochlamydia TaxID=292833 RepID=UPI001BFC46B8|nr:MULTISPECIES: hypothetical protein [Rhabdochlamydia]